MRRGDWWTDVVVVLCTVLVAICVGAAQSAERVIYVDAAATGAGDGSSWADAYHDLQEALADANEAPPAVIRVAQGVYRPTPPMGLALLSSAATFQLHDQVALEGGYAGVAGLDPDARDTERYRTILSGDLAGDDTPGEDPYSPTRMDNCYVVVTGSGTDDTAVIDGFTITGGNGRGMVIWPGSPDITRCRFVANRRLGIYARDCNSVLTECLFMGNGSDEAGPTGVSGTRSDLTMIDCTFVGNRGGAIDNNGALDLLRCSFTAMGTTPSSWAVVKNLGDLTARQCSFTSNRRLPIECYAKATLIDCVFAGNTSHGAGAVNASQATLTGCEFIGNVGRQAVVMAGGRVFRAQSCLFAGNSSLFEFTAISTSSAVVRLANCTFVGNRGRPNTIRSSPPPPPPFCEMSQCIVWDSPDPFTEPAAFPWQIDVTYSNVQGGYAGQGNIDVDPLFVDPGYWDPNGTPDDPDDDFYVVGDYHLKSQAGHWDRATETWIFDEVTSPCIDGGDPNAPLGAEPFPNGGFVNMGAYGGTAEASRSYFGEPLCETRIAGDINGDCRVDDLDLDILMSHWLMPDIGKPNIPPTIVLTSPEDGAELTYPAPIILQAEASDVDGTVLLVTYTIEYRTETWRSTYHVSSTDPTDGWRLERDWSKIQYDGVYTICARALDNDGAASESSTIHVTLRP